MLSQAEAETVAQRAARRYARDDFPYEDLAQEARFAIWQKSQSDPDLTEWQAYRTAKDRILRVIEQRPLGSERPPGRPPGKNGVKPVKTILTFDGVIYDDQAPVEPDIAAEVVRRVDVERALECLTAKERDLIRALYWNDMTWTQAREYLGVTPQAHWESARRKLREVLSEGQARES